MRRSHHPRPLRAPLCAFEYATRMVLDECADRVAQECRHPALRPHGPGRAARRGQYGSDLPFRFEGREGVPRFLEAVRRMEKAATGGPSGGCKGSPKKTTSGLLPVHRIECFLKRPN